MVDINCWFFTENFENELLSYFNNSKKDLKESRLSKIGPAASSKVITSKETIKRTIKQTNNKPNQTTKQPSNQTTKQPSNQTTKQPNNQFKNKLTQQTGTTNNKQLKKFT